MENGTAVGSMTAAGRRGRRKSAIAGPVGLGLCCGSRCRSDGLSHGEIHRLERVRPPAIKSGCRLVGLIDRLDSLFILDRVANQRMLDRRASGGDWTESGSKMAADNAQKTQQPNSPGRDSLHRPTLEGIVDLRILATQRMRLEMHRNRP